MCSKLMESDDADHVNCFVVNGRRSAKMACFATSLRELGEKARNWFGSGPGIDRVVLERNGDLVETDAVFYDLDVDDTLMYLNSFEKWEPNDKVDVKTMEAKPFYDLRKQASPRRVSKKIVALYRELAANNAFETDEAWMKLDENTVEDIWLADLEITEKLIKTDNKDALKLIKQKALELYCKRPSIKGQQGWSFSDEDGEDGDDFVTLADVTSFSNS